jgi:DNA-binding transcriptional LysR family regulator
MAELRQYRYFVEIARRGSFTAASRTLLVTQSALSEQMKQLESELDCRLFDRGRHGARLTPAGEALIPHAEQLLRLSLDVERLVGQWRARRQRQLRLAMTVPAPLDWIPDLLAEFEQAYDDVEILLEDTSTAEIFLRVSTGQLDLGVVSISDSTFEAAAPAGISATKLLEEDLVLLVPAAHRLAAFDRVPLGELRNERVIAMLQSSALRRVTNELLDRQSVRVRDTIESGRLDLAVRMVSVGLGICILPRSTTLLEHAPNVRVVEIDAPDPPRRILLALHRTDSPNAELTERLLGLIQARLASATGGEPVNVGLADVQEAGARRRA